MNDLVALAAADVGMAVGSSSASAGAAISDEHASVEGMPLSATSYNFSSVCFSALHKDRFYSSAAIPGEVDSMEGMLIWCCKLHVSFSGCSSRTDDLLCRALPVCNVPLMSMSWCKACYLLIQQLLSPCCARV